MKILIFGRGVIATQYGWALNKAGHTVEFYVRPGRSAQYNSTIKLDIVDGRTKRRTTIKENWPAIFREDLDANHNFDLIILSLNHNQIAEATQFLAPRIGKATVLVFNNFWTDPLKAIEPLPLNQIVWGFPGAGGGFDKDDVLKGGFMKSVFLGHIGKTTNLERYKSIFTLFNNAGFKITEEKDFRSWLWSHFAFNAGLAAMALKVGSYSKLMNSSSYLKESFLLTREMLPLLKAKGYKPKTRTLIMLHLPAGLIGIVFQKVLAKGNFARYIMDQAEMSGHTSYNLTALYARDVLAEARLRGIALPKLKAIEPYFE